jgi:hypothetical protein
MRKPNKWTLGNRHFVLPSLPDALRGRHGCCLQRGTFDPLAGEEVYALYREEPAYSAQYEKLAPFNLIAHTGLVRTPYGVVAFIIWQIAAGSPQEVMCEQYINPQDIGALRLISSAANQTHFKFIVINNESAEVCAFVDFKNFFSFAELASAMVSAIGHEPVGDFDAATGHVMKTMTVPQLIALSNLDFEGNC